MSHSLFIQLTQSETESYPVTSVSKYLIELIGKDVCAFRRNTQASYRLVEQARNVLGAINTSVKRVEEQNDWDAFENYTNAIDPLEEILFPLVDTAESERDQYLTKQDSVDHLITFIEIWATRRAELRSKLQMLRSRPEFAKLLGNNLEPEKDVKAAYQHDDNRLLMELVKKVARYTSTKLGIRSRTVHALILRVVKALQAVEALAISPSANIQDDSLVWSIKASMAVYGAMELLQNTQLGKDWLAHARSDVIWKAAADLVENIKAHLEQNVQKPTVAQIEEYYNAFMRLLKGSMTVQLPENYIKLMKQVGRIGRSHYAQAVYLVKLCRELAKYFSDTPVNQTAQNLEPLQTAVNETLQALEGAVQKDTTLKPFDLVSYDSSPSYVSFKAAENDIKFCFEKYGMLSEWADHETKLKTAVETDKARMKQFNDRLNKGVVPVDTATLVKVVLSIYKGKAEGSPLKTLEYFVRPTTRLSAIQWQMGRETYENLDKVALNKADIVKANTTDKLSLDVDMNSLASKGSQCDLTVIVGE